LHFPPWDCLPYDRASPSRHVMGRRMATLSRLTRQTTEAPPIVVTTVAAVLQRVPPQNVSREARLILRPGAPLSLGALEAALMRFGYIMDERIDEPGEAAIRGQVIDLFPAGSDEPVRLEHRDD